MFAAALAVLAAAPAAAQGIYRYYGPPPRITTEVYDCRAAGPGFFHGRFAGQQKYPTSEELNTVYGEGCFASLYDCRRWLNEMLSYAPYPPTYQFQCRPLG